MFFFISRFHHLIKALAHTKKEGRKMNKRERGSRERERSNWLLHVIKLV